ncbi:MAG: hypothetical protein ABIO53_17990 [Chitinophagaceae bacterium]
MSAPCIYFSGAQVWNTAEIVQPPVVHKKTVLIEQKPENPGQKGKPVANQFVFSDETLAP